jgi:hypothetical protein
LKKQNILLGVVASIALILAIFGVVVAMLSDSILSKILIIICSVFLAILALLYLIAILLSRDNVPNFFLYDEKKHKNIQIEQLDYNSAACRLDEYIERLGGVDVLFKRRGIENGNFGIGAILRPVIVYRLLYRSTQDDNILAYIRDCDNNVFTVLIHCLEDNGDRDMAFIVQKYRYNSVIADKFKHFLSNNQRYIQNRTMAYISKNIERFY